MAKKKKQPTAVVKLVRKSNNLVEAKYKFDIWETRVFTKMLSMIRPEDEDFKDYRIYLNEVIRDFNLSANKEAYEWLKRGARKLTKKTIKIIRKTDNGLTEFYAPIAVGVENPLDPNAGDEDLSYVDVSFHPKMKDELLALKSQFTTYDVRNVLKLPSSYSIRIYELLKQYERIGKRKFEFLVLKEIIGAIEEFEEGKKIIRKDHYPLYGNFRQRILLKAQKDLAKYTDISFTFDPIKRGRKVHAIQFYIFPNPRTSKTVKEPKQPIYELTEKKQQVKTPKKQHPLFAELYPQVKNWIGATSFQQLIERYPESQIRNSVRYTLSRIEKGDNINNVAGHIIAMAKQTSLFDAVETRQQQQKEEIARKKERAAQKKVLQQRLNQLKSALYHQEVAAIEQFMEQETTKKKLVLTKTREKPFSRYDASISDNENYTENEFFRMSVFSTVGEMFPEVLQAVRTEMQPKIKQVEEQLRRL